MSIIWTFDPMYRSASSAGEQSLEDYFDLAETYRHVHFAEGMSELEARANGLAINNDLDQQSVFAAQVRRYANQLQESGSAGEQEYLDLRRHTHLVWLCCFAGVTACDAVADLLELEKGWKARADFVLLLSEVRDALGPSYILDGPTLETDVESKAQARLRGRWQTEAVVARFGAMGNLETAAQLAWIEGLDRDCLHEFVVQLETGSEHINILRAVAEHPTCDKATAVVLWSRCVDALKQSSQTFEHLSRLAADLRARLDADAFGDAHLHPGDDRLDAIEALHGALPKDVLSLPGHVRTGFGAQRPAPRYTYCGEERVFRTSFSDWSAIRLVPLG